MPCHIVRARDREQRPRGPGRPSGRHFVSDGRRPIVGGGRGCQRFIIPSDFQFGADSASAKKQDRNEERLHRLRETSRTPLRGRRGGWNCVCGGAELFCEFLVVGMALRVYPAQGKGWDQKLRVITGDPRGDRMLTRCFSYVWPRIVW